MIATLVVFLLICIASYASGIAWSSFFEWLLHRFLMHSQKLMKYPHRAHQLEHHGIFAADGTYCIDHPAHNESSKKHLKFAWWNAPVLILLNAPIFAGIFFFVGGWPTMVSFILAMVSYYLAYEYLHYCMHVPRDRWFERTQVFKLIQKPQRRPASCGLGTTHSQKHQRSSDR
jgi:hypothetical protein